MPAIISGWDTVIKCKLNLLAVCQNRPLIQFFFLVDVPKYNATAVIISCVCRLRSVKLAYTGIQKKIAISDSERCPFKVASFQIKGTVELGYSDLGCSDTLAVASNIEWNKLNLHKIHAFLPLLQRHTWNNQFVYNDIW
jgi:hypothetical protein